jgi:uncharacterized protein YggE
MHTLRRWKWLFALAFLGPLTGYAQESDPRIKPRSITVMAEAVVMVEPNQVEIDIGVVSQSASPAEAANENAKRLSRVIAEMKKIIVASDEVKTAAYSLTPNYRYPKEGGRPEITGYTAINVVRVRTGLLGTVGVLIDTAMRAGANRVQRLAFALKDPVDAQRSALREATVKARSKAEEVARALGVKITKVLSVTESGGPGFQPRMAEPLAARADVMAAPPTPIETGSIEVRSTVTLTAEIAER